MNTNNQPARPKWFINIASVNKIEKQYPVEVLERGTNWLKVKFLSTGATHTFLNFQIIQHPFDKGKR